jgi:ribosome maturation factor RimP
MKNQAARIFRKVIVILTLALLAGVHTSYAQGTAYHNLATKRDIITPKSLAVAVFQVENTLKFRVHFENYAGDDVKIKIRNSADKVVYEETVKNTQKYMRKFDLSTMADDTYTFEITNKRESYTKEISLQTLSARSLQINE